MDSVLPLICVWVFVLVPYSWHPHELCFAWKMILLSNTRVYSGIFFGI